MHNHPTPKFSIITVTYNAEAVLEDTIQSVISQTYHHVEYILVDGASKDGTLSIIDRYRDRITRIVSEPDKGLYDAMNKGIRLATYASRCIENEILMHFRSLKKTMGDVSLSDVLDTDGEGNNLSLMDVLAQDDEMSEKIGDIELCGRLRGLVDSVLNEREARIIRLRYGLAGAAPMTQRETAKVCSISRSYVSRLEKKALEKLRSELGDDAYI